MVENNWEKMSKEKRAVLVLYTICIIMAIGIFLYLTRVKGYTPDNLLKLALMDLLPVLAVYFIGAIIIWKRYGSKLEEAHLKV
ncbi:hypothetical protein A3L04_01535 [Thermococcus chitonophagus]|uniref:Uncharacterized protein n=2 Tax=Thermococcus chitonophagus TaxID=54262 RepID=A0A170SBN1_9EURY|nr:hypothetical protein A3L04_01535 [Thermococcus chitonophagus]CUX77084.1 hypothetical protein CHITON_0305 [Thermococcus chitonophagus]